MPCASSNGHRCTLVVFRQTPQRVFPPIRKDQLDGFRKALHGFGFGLSLSVGTEDFRALSDEPLLVAFDDGGEFVVHRGFPLIRASEVHPANPAAWTGWTKWTLWAEIKSCP